MLCKKCGQQFEEGSLFCPYCGAEVEKTSDTAQQQSTPEQPAGPQQPVQQTQPGLQGPAQPTQPAPQGQPQMQYVQQPPQQPIQNQPAKSQQPGGNGGSKKGLIIGLVSAGVVLVAAVLLIFVFDVFHFFDKDDDKKAEETTTEVTEVTEETTEEVTTEAESTTEAPEPEEVPYGQEMGYTFSSLDTEVTYDEKMGLFHMDGTPYDVDADEYVENYKCISSIGRVFVSEPDSDGNVTYIITEYSGVDVDFKSDDFAEEKDENGSKFVWNVGSYIHDISDYYTGELIEANTVQQGEDAQPAEKIITWNDEDIKITSVNAYVRYNWPNSERTDGKEGWHDSSELYIVTAITVPEDYDGLMLSIPKKYNSSDDEDEDVSNKKLLDIKSYGYTGNADDAVFIKVSDVASTLKDEELAETFSLISSSDNADFSWFVDKVKAGQDPSDITMYNSLGGDITAEDAVLNDWDVYIVWDPEEEMDDYSEERYFGSITNEEGFTLTINPSERYDKDGNFTNITDIPPVSYEGTFNSDGSVTFDLDGSTFTISSFKTDGLRQYGFGELILEDGIVGKMLLVRP